jgi:hypothetical protein
MKKFLVVGLLAVELLVGSGMAVWAADDTENVTVTWDIQAWIDLLIATGEQAIDLGDVTTPDWDYTGTTHYTVYSNDVWNLYITGIVVTTKPLTGAPTDAEIIAVMNHNAQSELIDSGTQGETPNSVTWTLNIPHDSFDNFALGTYLLTYTLTAYNPPYTP